MMRIHRSLILPPPDTTKDYQVPGPLNELLFTHVTTMPMSWHLGERDSCLLVFSLFSLSARAVKTGQLGEVSLTAVVPTLQNLGFPKFHPIKSSENF